MSTNKLTRAIRLALIGGIVGTSGVAAADGPTQLAGAPLSGAPNGASLLSSISADGRYVVYQSTSSNLVSGDTNGVYDIFVFNRETGAVERVSVTSTSAQANGQSVTPSISADGRYVVFASQANNLVPGDTNGKWDVFMRDRIAGTTVRVSVDDQGNQVGSDNHGGVISADGRYIAFRSFHGFDPIDTNHTNDLYVKDTLLGTVKYISKAANGTSFHGGINNFTMSGDGTVFAWEASGYYFVNFPVGTTFNQRAVYVHDTKTGITKLANRGLNGAKPDGDSYTPSLNYDGTKLVFTSAARNLVSGDANNRIDVFMFDVATETIALVSKTEAGQQPNEHSATQMSTAVSADGRYVAFSSSGKNFDNGAATTVYSDVYVRDMVAATTHLVSKPNAGGYSNYVSFDGSVSADGRFVAYRSFASNLTADPVPGTSSQVFVTDRVTNEPPFAFAGYDQLVEATAINTPVTLDASGSSDPDEDALTYTWSGGFGLATGVGPVVALGLGTHDINLSVDDGKGGFASDQVQIIVQDTTPPSLTLPADIEVVAQGLETTVTLGAASVDDIFGPVELTNNAPAVFPIGETIVTYTATDANGNVSTAEQKVVVKYNFTGFEGPVTDGGVYKKGRTIPVKFKLYYADGTLALSATARLYAQRIENDVAVGDPIDLQATNGADSGNIFRIVGDSYMFNMDTSFASTGTYQILVDLGDGTALKAMEIGFK